MVTNWLRGPGATRRGIVALAAVMLAGTALGVLLWSLTTRSAVRLAWLTSMATIWAAILSAWAISAGMLAWALRSRRSIAASATRTTSPVVLMPPELNVPEWVVDRPMQLNEVVIALLRPEDGAVGITTGLHGAGGFGKTTLALMACADPRVRRMFRHRIHWVTVGRDVRGPSAVAAKVNEVIRAITGEEATFTDPGLAGARLGALLDAGPRRLLVLDDVWDSDQLAPLGTGGRRCARLVTTRVPGLLTGEDSSVLVDQMSIEQSQRLLLSGVQRLDPTVVDALLTVTGRWPLLLRLVSKILANAASVGADINATGRQLLERLQQGGPAIIDGLLSDVDGLDVANPAERARAVRATIEASTGLLSRQEGQRLAELGVFAEDEIIPFDVITQFWHATAGTDPLQASQICARLGELALISLNDQKGSPTGMPSGGVAMHDVVRDFMRAELGPQQLAVLNGMLLDAIAERLSAADVVGPDAATLQEVAWWELGSDDRYLRDHLIEHLLEAGRPVNAEAVASDLRWAGVQVRDFGPAALAADLALLDTARSARLRQIIERIAHLLTPTQPVEAVVDVLHSRVSSDPDWGPQVVVLRDLYKRPRLVNRAPLPDLPDPALRRVLTGHLSVLGAVPVAPDGTWLATSSSDGTVRIWDTGTWQQRTVLTVAKPGEYVVATIAPDGAWLATGGADGTVQIWNTAWQKLRTISTGHKYGVREIALAPDGSWLATGDAEGAVRIWDPETGQQRAALIGHTDSIDAMAAAHDGTWLATGGDDGTVRIWDTITWQAINQIAAHENGVNAIAISPGSDWFATGAGDGTVRIWDSVTGQRQVTFNTRRNVAGNSVTAIAIAADGTWLSTGTSGGEVELWETATWKENAIFTGHKDRVNAASFSPDGTWLATGSGDDTARIWDIGIGRGQATRTDSKGRVTQITIAPDCSWLVTNIGRDAAQIVDASTGQQTATITSNSGNVSIQAVAPDGAWLATSGWTDAVQIWDTSTWREKTSLTGFAGDAGDVAVAFDGTWLATSGWDHTVRIWDTATWQGQAILAAGHQRTILAMVVASDSSWLATRSRDGTVGIWDTNSWRLIATLRGHEQGASYMAIAPDGSWLAVDNGDDTVWIWDTITWQRRAILGGRHGASIQVVAPDGSWLATGVPLHDTVTVWDAVTWQELAALVDDRNIVHGAAVTPDGRWLVTGSENGTIRVWDTISWQQRALMRVDDEIYTCEWIGTSGIAVGGRAGLYLFDFLAAATGER
jgi:WD40 repeat protein